MGELRPMVDGTSALKEEVAAHFPVRTALREVVSLPPGAQHPGEDAAEYAEVVPITGKKPLEVTAEDLPWIVTATAQQIADYNRNRPTHYFREYPHF